MLRENSKTVKDHYPEHNLVLVGFMGTGKSTVGKILAKRMNRTFIDMDRKIEEREKTSISTIFAEHGEARFRGLESALALELAVTTKNVIACGGGIVLNEANLIALGMAGVVICLSAEPAAILERVSRNNKRPLLEGDDKFEKIKTLFEARRELYAAINHQVATDGHTLEEVSDLVETLYCNVAGK